MEGGLVMKVVNEVPNGVTPRAGCVCSVSYTHLDVYKRQRHYYKQVVLFNAYRDIDSICVFMGIITGSRLTCQIIRKKLHFLLPMQPYLKMQRINLLT